MGRLRQPGTCTVFTSVNSLMTILNRNNPHATEMANVILEHRTSPALKSALSQLLDKSIQSGSKSFNAAGAEIGSHFASFRFDVFARYCQSLHLQIAEFTKADTCTYCSILCNANNHTKSDCRAAKGLCNKCYYPGHNRCKLGHKLNPGLHSSNLVFRNYCKAEACLVPSGFCVMCLMPVHEVYELHTGRYGMQCTNDLKDCIKPLLITLYYSRRHVSIEKVAALLWPRGRPDSFMAFWTFLWSHDGDQVYGILKVLVGFMKVCSTL
jgi:hypothetical protein